MAHVGVRLQTQPDSLPPAGRLKAHLDTRKVITRDPWVVAIIKGYIQDRLPVRTSPESETSHSTILCGTESINSGGDKGTSWQRSHNRSAQPSGRVLLKLVFCPKEGL